MMVRRSALPYGSGLRRTALTTLKIAVLAPIPRARVMIAVRANAGFLRSVLAPSARSRDRVGIVLDQVVGRRPMGTARIALVDSILDRRVAPYKKDYALINPTDLTPRTGSMLTRVPANAAQYAPPPPGQREDDLSGYHHRQAIGYLGLVLPILLV